MILWLDFCFARLQVKDEPHYTLFILSDLHSDAIQQVKTSDSILISVADAAAVCGSPAVGLVCVVLKKTMLMQLQQESFATMIRAWRGMYFYYTARGMSIPPQPTADYLLITFFCSKSGLCSDPLPQSSGQPRASFLHTDNFPDAPVDIPIYGKGMKGADGNIMSQTESHQ